MESITGQTLQQLMFSLVEVWKSSEKSQQDFCREKEMEYNKFQYWLRKYRGARVQGDEKGQPSFVRVKVRETEKVTGSVELVYPDGRKLIFHQAVEASYLRSLLG